jgi:hypothetical protein
MLERSKTNMEIRDLDKNKTEVETGLSASTAEPEAMGKVN